MQYQGVMEDGYCCLKRRSPRRDGPDGSPASNSLGQGQGRKATAEPGLLLIPAVKVGPRQV